MSTDLVDTTGTTYIRHAEPEHRPAIERIYEDRWGEVHHQALDETLDEDDDNAIAAVAFRNEPYSEVVGFGTLFFGDADWAEEVVKPANVAFAVDGEPVDRVAYFQMGCVDRDHEGQGVGRQLFQRRLKVAKRRDADWAAGVCWKRTKGRGSHRLFASHGFKQIQYVEHYYWKAEVTRTTCPDCENICKCDGVVYARRVA